MKISVEKLRKITREYFIKLGCPDDEASIMTEELIGGNLRGVDSHGVLRIVEYTSAAEKGWLIPGAPISVVKETPCSAVVDFALNFGQVGATKAVEIVANKAFQFGMATVVSQRSNHVGRLGSYTEQLAKKGLVSFALASQSYVIVAPFGSSEGRMGTNPISFGAPSEGEAVVMDFATTTYSKGKIYIARDERESLPEGIIIDKSGSPSIDPNDLFDGGALLQLGGMAGGHKGFGLSVMCEAFCTFLSGQSRIGQEKDKWNNTLTLIAIDPEKFFGLDDYKEKMSEFIRYMKSSKSKDPSREVLMPGELESRTHEERSKKELYLPDKTWEDLKILFEKRGVGCE
ncbi:Ldh family oxidoreductase [Alkalibacter mobilis]|uniref:Ldh family oxidoreductase n=1 Tax=Alkalibacter mobilis TaxID=2787712 RepID=UPI0018A0B7FC|nr:Ldh family oxidoreductase [Alkalibacter mobilis]MBF7095695.1 Ldh family oxidoreductase [Alkalibacter mobilis]